MKKKLPVIIFGTSGASKDIYYWIKAVNEHDDARVFYVEGFIESDSSHIGDVVFNNERVIGCDDDLDAIIPKYQNVGLVVPFGNPWLREHIVKKTLRYCNATFPNIIHPSVIYDEDAGKIGMGNHIGPGAIIVSEYTFGDFNYISANSLLGHDIVIGNFNSINPSSSIAGNVVFGNRCTLGINATVIQDIHIGNDITIGAGAVVSKDLDIQGTYVGIPARRIK